MCVRSALQKIQHARLYRNVLFDAATGENAVQFWAELALAQQRKDHRVGEHRFHCLFAMHLAIDTQQNLYNKMLIILENYGAIVAQLITSYRVSSECND